MTILETAGDTLSGISWEGIGRIAFLIVFFLVVILLFVAFFLFIWWKSFNIRVNLYEPFGQIHFTEEEIERMKTTGFKGSTLKFDMVRKRVTHGKHTTSKGVPFFQTFMPLRKME